VVFLIDFYGGFMKKYEIVKEHSDFDNVINKGKSYKCKSYYIYYKDNGLDNSRFGLAVSKKIGHAFLRNRIKRQLRMIIGNNKNVFQKGMDYIIIVRKHVLDIDYNEMQDELISVVKNG